MKLNNNSKNKNDKTTELKFRDENANRVMKLLPGAIIDEKGGHIQISYEGVNGILVHINSNILEIRIPQIRWNGPHEPYQINRLWKEINCNEINDEQLKKLLEDAIAFRRSELRKCRYCGRKCPPGHMHNKDVCQGCAEKYLGVLH